MTGSIELADGATRVLIVEDEATIVEFLRVGLRYENYETVVAMDGTNGLRLAATGDFDLVILDLMLPDLSGMEVCRRLRAAGRDVPVIMLTARAEVADRVAGLKAGADDYLIKPFSFDELLARMSAVLRRRGTGQVATRVQILDLELDAETREVRRGNKRVELTPIEFNLLELLMRHPRRVWTRENLVARVWGYAHTGDTNFIEVHIGHLREKIGDKPPRLIHTVRGVGYTLRPEEYDEGMD